MHILSNESPENTIPFLGAAVFSLMFLFTVTFTSAGFSQVQQSFEPSLSMFALVGEGMIASWEGTEEAVYATAVYTGIIPLEESAYYAVDLPFHSSVPAPRVASAATTIEEPAVVIPEALFAVARDLPWQVLYDAFSGQ